MKHLAIDTLVDIAEGAEPGASAAHLDACADCRARVDDLRVMMDTARVPAPEPSPLFWDHFSARVREAIAHETAPSPRGRIRWVTALWPIAALACVVIVVMLPRQAPDLAMKGGVAEPLADWDPAIELAADDSWALVEGLGAQLDLDGAGEAGFVAIGSAEHAVLHLTNEERRELMRLLKAELGRPVS